MSLARGEIICGLDSNSWRKSICYITRRSHRVSAWTPSQLRSQYGIAHRRHLYNPQYPQTEQIIRGGYAEGGAPAVRYVGTLDGKDAML